MFDTNDDRYDLIQYVDSSIIILSYHISCFSLPSAVGHELFELYPAMLNPFAGTVKTICQTAIDLGIPRQSYLFSKLPALPNIIISFRPPGAEPQV